MEQKQRFIIIKKHRTDSQPQKTNSVNIPTDTDDAKKNFNSFKPVLQEKIIKLSPKERTIVNAGPGTGKTYTLIEKIKYMVQEQRIPPERILILCFSRAAVQVIRERIEKSFQNSDSLYKLKKIEVRTFDSFATLALYGLMIYAPEVLKENYSLDYKGYETRITDASNAIRDNPEILEFDHIFVDEVQDLVDVRAILVTEILRAVINNDGGFTLFGDSCQAIYDYQRKFKEEQFLSSNLFYINLFSEFKHCNFLALTKNYRQKTNELTLFTKSLRKEILNNDCTVGITGDIQKCFIPNIQLRGITKSELDLLDKGSIGILTRSNGEALQISSWFRNKNIDHVLYKRTDGRMNRDEWLYWIFSEHKHALINFDEFSNIINKHYSTIKANTVRDCWNSLTNGGMASYEVNDLIKNILCNTGKNDDYRIFKSLSEKDSHITISNIHQAKGKEFDTVILPSELFTRYKETVTNSKDDKQNVIDEKKVIYVSLTRPREKLIIANQNEDNYISINYDGRCYKTHPRYIKYRNLIKYEIGFAGDFDDKSFAASDIRQNYISRMKPGEKVILIKDKSWELYKDDEEDAFASVRYKIIPERDRDVILGYTSTSFWEQMVQIYHLKANLNYSYVKASYAPNCIDDLYVDRLTTCISMINADLHCYKQVGNFYIWLGLDIKGFGDCKKN